MIWVYLVELLLLGCCTVFQYMCPVDTGRKLNLHKTFRRRPWRLLNVWCTFSLRSVSTGIMAHKFDKIIRIILRFYFDDKNWDNKSLEISDYNLVRSDHSSNNVGICIYHNNFCLCLFKTCSVCMNAKVLLS